MATYEQAMTAREFHYAPACTKTRVERWRRNGETKVWKTREGEFRVPVKFGLRSYSYITHLNAGEFHVASECEFHD
jgi:saccharopine dehydrogenase-like NADP-dependent oxidoreductase